MVESKKKNNLSKSLPSPKNSTRLFLLMRGGREGSEGEGSRGGKEGRERGEGRREGGMGQRKRGGKEGRNNMRVGSGNNTSHDTEFRKLYLVLVQK